MERRPPTEMAARKAQGERRVQLRKEYSQLFRIATDRKKTKQREIRAQRANGQITAQQFTMLLDAMRQEFQESLTHLSQHPYWIEFVTRKSRKRSGN